MNNIILDTNAFIYLMRNEKECSNTISLENRQINESKFYDECKNANYLFITSQTLYEIFWQSIKKTKKIDQFAYYYDQIIKFKNKYYQPYLDNELKCFKPKTEVLVINAFNNDLIVSIDEKVYELKELSRNERFSKEFDEVPIIKEKTKYIPPMTHPWKIEYFKIKIFSQTVSN